MAKGDVEIAPALRHGVGDLEDKGSAAGETAGISHGTRSWVVSVALRDPRGIDEQSQKAPTVAASVEYPLSSELDVNGVEHRLPNETVLMLHGFVFDGATPVG